MVDEIIKQIHQGKMIDGMTKKYQYSRIPIFYKLTKIHKPIPVGRPIISGRDGPTERIYFLWKYYSSLSRNCRNNPI